MQIKTINRLIGYGILIFVLGNCMWALCLGRFAWFMHLGSILTFIGVFYFFKDTDLQEQFRKDPKEDVLTYFWNVIVLKLWTGIFVLIMIASALFMIFSKLSSPHKNI
jgi:hypothetical protein